MTDINLVQGDVVRSMTGKVVLAAADSRHLNALQKKFFDSAL